MQQRWMLYSPGTTTSQHLRTFYGNYNHTRTVWMCAHTWLNAERINSLSWAWRGTASGHRWPTGAHHLRSGAFNRAAVTANEADLLHSFFFFCIPISQRHHLKSVVYVSLSSHHVHVRQSVGRFDYSNDVSWDVFTQSTWNFSHCKTDSQESSSYYSCGSFATVFFFTIDWNRHWRRVNVLLNHRRYFFWTDHEPRHGFSNEWCMVYCNYK